MVLSGGRDGGGLGEAGLGAYNWPLLLACTLAETPVVIESRLDGCLGIC